MKELKVAIKAAKEAGKIINGYFDSNLKVEKKADNSPVTIADKETEKKIVSIIRKHFPDHNFLGEEFQYQHTDSKYKWIIDPIDGTKNFVRGVPFFGPCIGLEKKGEIIAGVIYIPKINLFGYASKGKGTFINGKKVRTSKISNLANSYFIFNAPKTIQKDGLWDNFSKLILKVDSSRSTGSPMSYLFVAQGSADIFLDGKVSPWDVAAPKIIIEEAGGRFTDFNGKDTIYSGNALATNGLLHDEVLEMLNKVK